MGCQLIQDVLLLVLKLLKLNPQLRSSCSACCLLFFENGCKLLAWYCCEVLIFKAGMPLPTLPSTIYINAKIGSYLLPSHVKIMSCHKWLILFLIQQLCLLLLLNCYITSVDWEFDSGHTLVIQTIVIKESFSRIHVAPTVLFCT